MGKLQKGIPPLTKEQTSMAETPSKTLSSKNTERIQRSIRLPAFMWKELEETAEALGGISVNATVSLACKRLINDEKQN